jgi:hypothetical protein
MSAFKAGHLRKAPVAAVMVIGGGSSGMRTALNPNTGTPLLIDSLHPSGVFLSKIIADLLPFTVAYTSADLDLTFRLFSYPSITQYGGSP